jgi:hypothetical protein
MAQVTRINSTIVTTLLAFAFMLSGCGAGNDQSKQTATSAETTNPAAPAPAAPVTQTPAVNSNVRYEGTSLVVYGKSYVRVAPTESFARGQIIVKAKLGMETEFTNFLKEASLSTIRELAAGGLLISVPVDFEEQWVRALKAQAFVEYAELDGIATIQ